MSTNRRKWVPTNLPLPSLSLLRRTPRLASPPIPPPTEYYRHLCSGSCNPASDIHYMWRIGDACMGDHRWKRNRLGLGCVVPSPGDTAKGACYILTSDKTGTPDNVLISEKRGAPGNTKAKSLEVTELVRQETANLPVNGTLVADLADNWKPHYKIQPGVPVDGGTRSQNLVRAKFRGLDDMVGGPSSPSLPEQERKKDDYGVDIREVVDKSMSTSPDRPRRGRSCMKILRDGLKAIGEVFKRLIGRIRTLWPSSNEPGDGINEGEEVSILVDMNMGFYEQARMEHLDDCIRRCMVGIPSAGFNSGSTVGFDSGGCTVSRPFWGFLQGWTSFVGRNPLSAFWRMFSLF